MRGVAFGLSKIALPETQYPEGAGADEIEAHIASSLPVIPGLTPDMPQTARLSLLADITERARETFVSVHGDAFGCTPTRQVERSLETTLLRPGIAVAAHRADELSAVAGQAAAV